MRTTLRRSLVAGAAALATACLLVPSASAQAGAETTRPDLPFSAPDRGGSAEVRAAAANPRQIIAVTGTNNRLFVRDTATAGFKDLGGTLIDTPAVALAPGGTYFIGVGGDRSLWIRSFTRGWQRFGPSHTRCAGPSAVVSADTFAVACRGGDNALYVAKTKLPLGDALPQVTGFKKLGGVLRHGVSVSDVAAAGSATPYFVYSGLGTDDRPYARDDASGWEPLLQPGGGAVCGGTFSMSEFFETAACKASGAGDLRTFEIEEFAPVGTIRAGVVGRPGVAVDADLTTRYYVLGTDKNIYVATHERGGTPSGFSRFGGAGLYGVAAVSID